MDYATILDPVPWKDVGIAVLQTITLYWLVLVGLKFIGRRTFGEMGPQDVIILLLVAEACDLGLTPDRSGYWGTVFSVLTILAMGHLIERIPALRKAMDSDPITLFKKGQLQHMEKTWWMKAIWSKRPPIRAVAFRDFETITLENDGSLTGTLKTRLPR